MLSSKCQTVSISNSWPTQQVVRYWEKCFLGKLKSLLKSRNPTNNIQHRRCTSLFYDREHKLTLFLAWESTLFIFTWHHAGHLGCPKLIFWTLFLGKRLFRRSAGATSQTWSWFLLLQKRLSATFDDRHGKGKLRWWFSCVAAVSFPEFR